MVHLYGWRMLSTNYTLIQYLNVKFLVKFVAKGKHCHCNVFFTRFVAKICHFDQVIIYGNFFSDTSA